MKSESELVQHYRDLIVDLLSQIKGLEQERMVIEEQSDSKAFIVSVPKDSRTYRRLYVVAREVVRPSHFERLATEFARAPKHALPVLAAPTLSRAVIIECRKRGWGHLDAGGNCRLSIYPIHIERDGRTIPTEAKPPKRKLEFDLSTEREATVVGSLLGSGLGKSFTDRDVVGWCNGQASVGYVVGFLRFLESNDYLNRASGKPGFVIKDLAGLLRDLAAAQSK